MTVPLPAEDDEAWYDWATYIHDAVTSAGAAMQASGAGLVRRGVIVPAGSLDRARSAMLASKTGGALAEWVILGDSTTFGANDFEGGTIDPWPKRLRESLVSAGFAYGGRGLFNSNYEGSQVALADPDGFPKVTATTGTWSATTNSGVQGWTNNVPGSTKSIQGTGTAVRINFARAQGGSAMGKLGITIDGGTEVILDGILRNPNPTSYDVLPWRSPTLTEGTHTVVLRNAGPSDIKGPSDAQITIASFGSAGGPSSGTYWYVLTASSANGESLPSTPVSITVNGSQVPQISYYAQAGWTAANLYRSTTQTGTYGLVTTSSNPTAQTVMGATKNNIADGASATPGAAPPTVNTLGTWSTANRAEFGIEFLRAGGFVLHQEAVSGNSAANFFDYTATTAHATRAYTPARLGLQSETQASANRSTGYMIGLPLGARPLYRDVSLTVIQIGTNDINGYSAAAPGTVDENVTRYIENLAYGIRTIRAAGSDVLLISPPFTAAADPGQHNYQGRFKSALVQLAMSHGCAYADFQEALGWDVATWPGKNYQGGGNSYTNPHLKAAGYNAESDWLWANLLQPLLGA